MHVGTHVTFSFFEEVFADPYRGARITREFPGAMFDRITSDLESSDAVSTVGIWRMRYLYVEISASKRTLRIDFIRCYSSIRLIDGNAVKRAASRLLAWQVDLMAYLARVLDFLATIRHVPPFAFSHSTLCYPLFLFASQRCPRRTSEFAILTKQVHS